MTRDFTPDECARFERFLTGKFGAHVLNKSDDIVMSLIGFGLETFGGMPQKRFLESFATTLGPLVWIPDSWDPTKRAHVLVHEIEHVEQWKRDLLGMPWLYLTHGESRATYEAQAYAAAAEFTFARHGALPTFEDMTTKVDPASYMLDAVETEHTRLILESRATSIASGVKLSRVAQAAIDWCRANAPDLLAGGR